MLRRLLLAAAVALAPSLAHAQFATIGPTPPTSDNGDRLATTAWVNGLIASGLTLASGKIWIGSAGNIATPQTPSGDCTLSLSGVITCTQAAGNFQVIGNLSVGGSIIDGNGILATNIVAPATPAAGTTRIYVDSTTKVLTFKNDAGTVGNAVLPSTCTANQFGTSVSAAGVFGCAQPAIANISGFGTGVAAALAINVGAAGAPVLFNGAGGTPSSITLTNGAGLPIGGITGLGTGIGTALAVNVGTGGSPVINGGVLGTPSSGVGTNLTGTASGLTAGNVTTNANQTGDVTSVGNATSFTGKVGGALGQIPGTTGATNASTGNVGEYVSSTVAVGSPVSVPSTGSSVNLTLISLTAGDWDVSLTANATLGATTSITRFIASMGTTTGTLNLTSGFFNELAINNSTGIVPTQFPLPGIALTAARFSLASTTTIFAVVRCDFTVSTCGAVGVISARRAR